MVKLPLDGFPINPGKLLSAFALTAHIFHMCECLRCTRQLSPKREHRLVNDQHHLEARFYLIKSTVGKYRQAPRRGTCVLANAPSKRTQMSLFTRPEEMRV